MTPFSASPETTLRIIRPTPDDDMLLALRRARARRRGRRSTRIIARN